MNGIPVKFQAYALKNVSGDATDYVKLRDIAYVLNGTGAQFEVGWGSGSISLSTGNSYTVSGGEMDAPFTGDQRYQGGTLKVTVNGQTVPLTAITLIDSKGGGHNYFKLRDLGQALGFDVGWSTETGVTIQTK